MASNTSIKTKFSKGIDLAGEEVINVTAIRHADGANGQIVFDGDLSVTGTFSLPAGGDLIPTSNNSQQVGQAVLRWANAHVANVYCDNIDVGTSVLSSLIPGTNSEAFGNTSKVWTVFTDKVEVRSAAPQIFMREGDVTDNNYRISVESGQFKLDRVSNTNSSPTNVFYAEDDGTVVFNNDVRVTGNLQIDGTELVINASSLEIEDTFIVLNKNHTGAATQDAGITINRGSDANVQIMWNETDNAWQFTGDYNIAYIAGSIGAFVMEVENNNATYGQFIKLTGNTNIAGGSDLRLNGAPNSNQQIIFEGSTSSNAISIEHKEEASLNITYANGQFTTDRIATVNRDVRTYALTSQANTADNEGVLRLRDDNSNDDVVNFVGSGAITVESNTTQITISGTDNHTTYGISAAANASNANVALTATGSNTTASAVKFIGAGGATVNSNGSGTVTIHSLNDNDDTTYSISAVANTSGANLSLTAGGSGSGSDQITFAGSGATTVTRTSADVITISSTDDNDNTTYDLSTGGVNASVANLNLTASGSGTGTDVVRFVGSGLVTVSSNATHIIATGATPSLDAVLAVGNTTAKDISVRNLTATGNTQLGDSTSDRINTQGRFSNSVIPNANNAYDLGSATLVWRNVYTGDLNMSNMDGDPNEVDGTKGSWSIQEGEDDLFLINKRNGKKYKFKLEEVK